MSVRLTIWIGSQKVANNVLRPCSLVSTMGEGAMFICSPTDTYILSHGGSAVSQFLRQELHGLFEHVQKTDVPEIYAWIREIGGYFKRFRGGAIQPWIDPNVDMASTPPFDLEARATATFFQVIITLPVKIEVNIFVAG